MNIDHNAQKTSSYHGATVFMYALTSHELAPTPSISPTYLKCLDSSLDKRKGCAHVRLMESVSNHSHSETEWKPFGGIFRDNY